MAKENKILTREQERLLNLASQEPYLCKKYYFTGGTPLSVFYLKHRYSEDIDLFSEQEIYLPSINTFIAKAQKKLKLEKVDYRRFLGLHAFQLFFSAENILKVDFNYYPYPRIEKGMKYGNISVDSVLDIAVNKVHTIYTKARARDFVDLFFIIREFGYDLKKLILDAKAKFDWHIDPIQLGSRLIEASESRDYPRMIKKINHQEWKDFFATEARKLKKEIFK